MITFVMDHVKFNKGIELVMDANKKQMAAIGKSAMDLGQSIIDETFKRVNAEIAKSQRRVDQYGRPVD